MILLLSLGSGAATANSTDASVEAEKAFAQALQDIQASQWGHAELSLERSLMFNPEHADARLQLALLLAQRGRVDAARSLIDSLIDDPRTPPAHRSRLRALLANSAPSRALEDPPSSQTRGEITVGRTRNPFARAEIDSLVLTLPDGAVTLPLIQNVHPASSVAATVRHTREKWGFELNTQHWAGTEPRTADRLLFFGNASIGGQAMQWNALTLRSIDGLTRQAVGISLPYEAWRVSSSLFSERELARRGFTLRVDRAISPTGAVQAVAFAEIEHATAGHPSNERAGLFAEWAPADRWLLSGQIGTHRDREGYSAWLGNGVSRSMQTVSLALERYWEPAARWRWVTRAHIGRRWSNIALFEYRDAGLQFSLQRLWP